MNAAAFGLALGGLTLVFMAAVTKTADGPRPPGGPPGFGYSKGFAETGHQRRRVATVGVVCLVLSLGLVVAAALVG